MQIETTEWLVFWVNTTIAVIFAFLIDFLVIRHVIRHRIDDPVDIKDEKQIQKFYGFSLGIIPGLLVFLYLQSANLLFLSDRIETPVMITVFAVLLVIASYSGAKIASLTTKQERIR